MTRRESFRFALVATLVATGIVIIRPPVTDARPPAPSVSKNYRLTLTHKTSQTFTDLEDEAEESVRVETIMMRTSTHPKVVRWRERLDRLKGRPPLEQVDGVNEMINGTVRYIADYKHWEREDRWGFPYATLDEGVDCEDFATLKRVSLCYLGWKEDDLHLLLGFTTYNSSSKPETHAVLLVTLPDRSQVILDNMEKRILPPADSKDFTPMIAIDRSSFYLVGKA